MRVLVTGAYGFVGSVVARHLLDHGHDVVALTHAGRPRFTIPGATAATADLRDRAALVRLAETERIEGVCHLGALTKVRESVSDPLNYFDTNVSGTLNLLAALDQVKRPRSEPARFVLASTSAVYGLREGRLSETDPAEPAHPYGASKLMAEQIVGYGAAAGRLSAISLRCFNIAGAHGLPDSDRTRIIPKALAVAAGAAEILEINGEGTAVRDYVHVVDVAEAYRLALESASPGVHRVYNVGSQHGISLAEIVEAVRRVTGRPVPTRHQAPKPEAQAVLADSNRIRHELGWGPLRSDLDQLVKDGWDASVQLAARSA